MREYFDKELTQLNDSLIEMGGLVEQAIKNTMKMIVDGEDLLDIAREHENRINEAEKSIQSRCLHLSSSSGTGCTRPQICFRRTQNDYRP